MVGVEVGVVFEVEVEVGVEVVVGVVVGVEVGVEVVFGVVFEVGVGVSMTKLEYNSLALAGFTPLPGRCVIHLDPVPSTIGRIVVPDSAKVQVVKACGYLGRVLAVCWTDKEQKEQAALLTDKKIITGIIQTYPPERLMKNISFTVGDRVLLGLHLDDLTEEVIWARNPQVDAVVTE